MNRQGIVLLCLALSVSTCFAGPTSSSASLAKPEESKLKADAKDLIKASASSNDYSQLAADYAVEKQSQSNSDPKVNSDYSQDNQGAYSQPLASGGAEYSQPIAYPQPIAYQPPAPAASSQYGNEQVQPAQLAPGAPGYEQPASAAVADAYNVDHQQYGQQQYSQQYGNGQAYQTYQSNQQAAPAYQPAQPVYPSNGPAPVNYQIQPQSPSYAQNNPVVNGYSQPLDLSYNQPQAQGYLPPPPVPAQSYSEISYTQSGSDYAQNGYQNNNQQYNAQPAADYQVQGALQNDYAPQAKPKKTVILAIPVKLVSKNKYNGNQEQGYGPVDQSQYGQVQPAAAGIAVSHQNQDSHDNSGNAYYGSYPPQNGPDAYKQDNKPVYSEKNEDARNQHQGGEYNEQGDKPKHLPIVPVVNNHINAGPGPKPYGNNKPVQRPPRGPRPYGEGYEIINGPIEEEPVEIHAAHGEHMQTYGPISGDLDANQLQGMSYMQIPNNIGKPGKPAGGEYFESNFAPFTSEIAGFGGYNAGPAGPIGFHNPMELLYSQPNIGKSPFSFGPGKPIPFGRPNGYGPPPPPPHPSASSHSSSSSGGYGQLLNSLFNVYSFGGSKNSKPSSSGSSKGISSYFNNLDLFKSYSSLSPNYLSSLYSSASSPSKQYLSPPGGKPINFYPHAGPSPMSIPQHHQHHQHQQQKPKPSGLIASPSNIASAIEEMFKTSLNPVSKFRRPLYSDATKALTNFYKKLIN